MGQNARIVQILARGQIALPADFRQQLGLDEGALLKISLIDDRIEVKPIASDQEALREYTDEEIRQFLEDDKLDASRRVFMICLRQTGAVRRIIIAESQLARRVLAVVSVHQPGFILRHIDKLAHNEQNTVR